MKILTSIFGSVALFFALVGLSYGLLTHWEQVGSAGLMLVVALVGWVFEFSRGQHAH